MKKNQLFAPFLMLFAGAAASILMYCLHYSMRQMLMILLPILIIFYVIGLIIQKKVTSFVEKIKEEEASQGEVIEKDAPEEPENDALENAEEENKVLKTEETAQQAE